MTAATSTNAITAFRKSPYRNFELLMVKYRLAKSGLPNMAATSGVIRSLTRAGTTVANAAPMTKAMARSTTLPRRRNSRKPFMSNSFDRSSLPRDLVGQRRWRHLEPAHSSIEQQQFLQNVGAGAVHRTGVEIEDRRIPARHGSVTDPASEEVRHRHPDQYVHLARMGHRLGARADGDHEGMQEVGGGGGGDRAERAQRLQVLALEAQLLPGLAERGVEQVEVAGLRPPAREGDLAGVLAHAAGALDHDHLEAARALVQWHADARRDAALQRPARRAEVV